MDGINEKDLVVNQLILVVVQQNILKKRQIYLRISLVYNLNLIFFSNINYSLTIDE